MKVRDINEELVEAIKTNNIELAKAALENGADPNFKITTTQAIDTFFCNQAPAFFFARSHAMLTFLLNNGANPNIIYQLIILGTHKKKDTLTTNYINEFIGTISLFSKSLWTNPSQCISELQENGPTFLQFLVINQRYELIPTLITHKQCIVPTRDINEAILKLLKFYKREIEANRFNWTVTDGEAIVSLIQASTNLLEKADGHEHSPFSFVLNSIENKKVIELMIKNNFILVEDILHDRDNQFSNVSENKFITFLAFAQKFQFLLLAWKLDENSHLNILPADIIFFIMKPLLDLNLQEEDIKRYNNYCKENNSLASKMLEFKKTYNLKNQSTFSNRNFLQDNGHLSHSSLFARATEYAEHHNKNGLVAETLNEVNHSHQSDTQHKQPN